MTDILYAKDFPPDLTGIEGSMAWKTLEIREEDRVTNPPPPELTTCSWIVRAPWAHPFWRDYLVACVNLKHVEGYPPAIIRKPGATHEVFVYALDPEHEPPLNSQPHFLSPQNYVGQFKAPSDDAAAALVDAAVFDIVHGFLSPDTDFRHQWIARFGDDYYQERH